MGLLVDGCGCQIEGLSSGLDVGKPRDEEAVDTEVSNTCYLSLSKPQFTV